MEILQAESDDIAHLLRNRHGGRSHCVIDAPDYVIEHEATLKHPFS